MLFLLALVSSCTTKETSSHRHENTDTSPKVESNSSEVDTIFLGIEDNTQNSERQVITPPKEYKNIKGSQIPTILQEMYQKAEKAMGNVGFPKTEQVLSAEKPTYFYDETAIGKYFSQAIKESEILTFTPSLFESVSIKGKEGTILTFPPACLVDEMGNPVTSPVQIELRECYKMKDMLFSNLSTTSSDMILETGGMVYVQATCNGKPLHLMATHPIMIEMPTKEKQKGMELFYGEKRPASGVMNWRVADTKKGKRAEKGEDMQMVKSWERIDEPTKIYDIGEIELNINLQEKTSIDGKPVVSFEVKNINPKLKKYKEIITATLNQVAWEKDQKAKASGKALYEYKEQCLLGNIIFANLSDLLAIREEIAKYKNFHFHKTIALQAHINKDFYYKKRGLIDDYVFDRALWQEDSRFFETNFSRVKEKKVSNYKNLLAEMEASKEALMDSYSAHYAVSYLFSSNQMGWLNCDRFDTNTGDRTDLMVNYDNPQNTDIKLIVAENRIIIPARDLGKRVVFQAAPKGKKAVLFATKLMNDIPYFCLKEIVIGKDKNIEINDFKQMSMAELEQEMIRLGIAS